MKNESKYNLYDKLIAETIAILLKEEEIFIKFDERKPQDRLLLQIVKIISSRFNNRVYLDTSFFYYYLEMRPWKNKSLNFRRANIIKRYKDEPLHASEVLNPLMVSLNMIPEEGNIIRAALVAQMILDEYYERGSNEEDD